MKSTERIAEVARGARWRPASLAAIVAAAALIITVATTVSLWSADADFAGGAVSAGTMDATIGDPTWRQVAPAGGTDGQAQAWDDLAASAFMPGDVIELAVPVRTHLVGDNLAAELSVSFPAPAKANDVGFEFSVTDGDRTVVAPHGGLAQPGETLVVPVPEPGQKDWFVIVIASIGGEDSWVPVGSAVPAVRWPVEDLTVTLTQVRPGGHAVGGN